MQNRCDGQDTPTAWSFSGCFPASGLGSTDHADPFQVSTSVPLPSPAAMQKLVVTHDTEFS
jgi:hypothetical protein